MPPGRATSATWPGPTCLPTSPPATTAWPATASCWSPGPTSTAPRSRSRPSGPACPRRPWPTASTRASRPASPEPASPSTSTPGRRPAGTTRSPRSCSRACTAGRAGALQVAVGQGATQPAAFCAREGRSLPDRYLEGTCPSCGAPDARGDQCDTCGRTIDPEELGGPRCRRCDGPAELRPLRQLFLRLDLLQPGVARYLDGHEARWRPFVGAEARGWLASGLRPRAITRDLDWGVPVPLPGWDDRRLYGWFDAVIGYLSASVEWAERHGDPDAWRCWWQGAEARHRYFVGKDNIWFHTVWWPAILLGAGQGLRPPDEVVANHYLTLSGGKLSASRGRAPTIDEGIDRVGLDPLRHALCALGPETADVELAWDKVAELTASGLLGAIAGPPHRVATLLWRRFGGRPDPAALAAAAPERAQAAAALTEVGT